MEQLCSINEAFRATLAQVTLRLCNQSQQCHTVPAERPLSMECIFLSPQLTSVIHQYPCSFSSIVSLCGGIGCYEYNHRSYQTYLPSCLSVGVLNSFSAFRVHALNLRTVVTLLTGQKNPVARGEFRHRNSLPGARFNLDTNRLTNGDEVCPVNWPDRPRLVADFERFNALLEFASAVHRAS